MTEPILLIGDIGTNWDDSPAYHRAKSERGSV